MLKLCMIIETVLYLARALFSWADSEIDHRTSRSINILVDFSVYYVHY